MADELSGADRMKALERVLAVRMDEDRKLSEKERATAVKDLITLSESPEFPVSQYKALEVACRLAHEYEGNAEVQLKIMTRALREVMDKTAKDPEFTKDPEKVKNIQRLISAFTDSNTGNAAIENTEAAVQAAAQSPAKHLHLPPIPEPPSPEGALKMADRMKALERVLAVRMDEYLKLPPEKAPEAARHLIELAEKSNWAFPEAQQAALKEAARLARGGEYAGNAEAQLKLMTNALRTAMDAAAKDPEFTQRSHSVLALQNTIGNNINERSNMEVLVRTAAKESAKDLPPIPFDEIAYDKKQNEARRAEFNRQGEAAATVPEREGHKATANAVPVELLPNIEVGTDGQASLKGSFTKEQAEAIIQELNNPRGSLTLGEGLQSIFSSVVDFATLERVEGTDQYRVQLKRDEPDFKERANLQGAIRRADKFTSENADKAAAQVKEKLEKIEGFGNLQVEHKRDSMQAEISLGTDVEGQSGTGRDGKSLSAIDRAGEALAEKIHGKYDKDKHSVIVDDISRVAAIVDPKPPVRDPDRATMAAPRVPEPPPNPVKEIADAVGEARRAEIAKIATEKAAIEKERALQRFTTGSSGIPTTQERAELLAELHAPPQPRAVASTPTTTIQDDKLVPEFEKAAAKFVDLDAQSSNKTLTADERAGKIKEQVDHFKSLDTTQQRSELQSKEAVNKYMEAAAKFVDLLAQKTNKPLTADERAEKIKALVDKFEKLDPTQQKSELQSKESLNKYMEADIKYPRLQEEKIYKEAVEKWVAAEHKVNPTVDVEKVKKALLLRGTGLDSEAMHHESERLTRLTEAAVAPQKAQEARSEIKTFCEKAGIQSHLKWDTPGHAGDYMVQMPDYVLAGGEKDPDAMKRREDFKNRLNSLIPENERDPAKPLARVVGTQVLIDTSQLAKVDQTKLTDEFKKALAKDADPKVEEKARAAAKVEADRKATSERVDKIREEQAKQKAVDASKMAGYTREMTASTRDIVARTFRMHAQDSDTNHDHKLDDKEKIELIKNDTMLRESLERAQKYKLNIPEIALLEKLQAENKAKAAEAPTPGKPQGPQPGSPTAPLTVGTSRETRTGAGPEGVTTGVVDNGQTRATALAGSNQLARADGVNASQNDVAAPTGLGTGPGRSAGVSV